MLTDKSNKTAVTPDSCIENSAFQKSVSDSIDFDSSDKTVTAVQQNNDIYDKNIYCNEISQYSDVIIPPSNNVDSGYLGETLFIGDSNTSGLSAFGYLPLQNVLGKKSMGIQGVVSNKFVWFEGYSQPVDIVTAVKLLKPRRIIMNFGTNNTVGTSAQDFVKIYRNAIAAIREVCPYSDIIIAAVLPVGYYRENYNITQTAVDSFNIALAQMCREISCTFLDYSEAFKNADTGYMQSDCVAPDGVHLNNRGYKILLEYVNGHQLITPDRRPDTDNIPVIAASSDCALTDTQTEAVNADDFAQNDARCDNAACDNANDGSFAQTDNSMSQDGCSETDNLSDSDSDLNIINSEKIIYDPFS